MKKWLLWTIVCILCVGILLFVGKYFSYTGNKVKINLEEQPRYHEMLSHRDEIQTSLWIEKG